MHLQEEVLGIGARRYAKAQTKQQDLTVHGVWV
jgi:hypothetical protein